MLSLRKLQSIGSDPDANASLGFNWETSRPEILLPKKSSKIVSSCCVLESEDLDAHGACCSSHHCSEICKTASYEAANVSDVMFVFAQELVKNMMRARWFRMYTVQERCQGMTHD